MTGQEKLETCQFRSAETFQRRVRICCNNFQEISGFDCSIREIFPVNSDHCNNCKVFKAKQ